MVCLQDIYFKITQPPQVKRSTLNSDLSLALKNTEGCKLAVIKVVSGFFRMYFHSVQFKFCEKMFKMIDDPNNSLEFLCTKFNSSGL